ncbi:MAG TPA: TIGR04282 family arsenosugar biosynthesis glycosyltransferase [Alphaproteobacteria bacterium]
MARLARQLVIFVKAPRRGAVKTRLARDIGAGAAQRFARACARETTRRLARDPRWRCWLAVTPDRFARTGRFWPNGPARLAQGPGDLGARMARPLLRLPPGPVVRVGSDIPALRADHVARAFRALGRAEAVFGPAADGGYWLIGLSRRPALRIPFRGVAWSTGAALAETRARLPRAARVAYLETLEDIDDAAAWRRWRAGT